MGVILCIAFLAMLLYRLFKDRFSRYNRENMQLSILGALISFFAFPDQQSLRYTTIAFFLILAIAFGYHLLQSKKQMKQ